MRRYLHFGTRVSVDTCTSGPGFSVDTCTSGSGFSVDTCTSVDTNLPPTDSPRQARVKVLGRECARARVSDARVCAFSKPFVCACVRAWCVLNVGEIRKTRAARATSHNPTTGPVPNGVGDGVSFGLRASAIRESLSSLHASRVESRALVRDSCGGSSCGHNANIQLANIHGQHGRRAFTLPSLVKRH